MGKKTGIMGGTFNPIHTGHLILAEYAYEQFKLDEILIMPSGNPPHKDKENIAPALHRVNMIQHAIEDNPHFSLSTLELEREGNTYTVDTLNLLNQKTSETEYYFIIGADSLFQIETWKDPAQIFSLCKIIAASRYHIPKEEIITQCDYLNEKYHGEIFILNTPNMDISSKMLRARIAAHKGIRYYVPAKVETYIAANNLYEEGSEMSDDRGSFL